VKIYLTLSFSYNSLGQIGRNVRKIYTLENWSKFSFLHLSVFGANSLLHPVLLPYLKYIYLTLGHYIFFRFRLVTKGLVAFISSQMPSNASLRLNADAPGALVQSRLTQPPTTAPPPTLPSVVSPSLQATQCLLHLESLKTNKLYTAYKQHIDLTIALVCNPQLSLRDATDVLVRLVSPLFPEVNHLAIMQRKRTA